MRIFVSGTGTGIGKTVFACALARAARTRGWNVAAIKPMETGCDPEPADARALAEASGREELAQLPGLYRVRPPLSPYAATLRGEPAPDLDAIADATRRGLEGADVGIVEGAGGVLVPLDAERTMADLAHALELPVVLVARDGLGVLSSTLTAAEAVERRGLGLAHVVLARHGDSDPSRAQNRTILAERLRCPVTPFERDGDVDPILDALTAG